MCRWTTLRRFVTIIYIFFCRATRRALVYSMPRIWDRTCKQKSKQCLQLVRRLFSIYFSLCALDYFRESETKQTRRGKMFMWPHKNKNLFMFSSCLYVYNILLRNLGFCNFYFDLFLFPTLRFSNCGRYGKMFQVKIVAKGLLYDFYSKQFFDNSTPFGVIFEKRKKLKIILKSLK